MPDTNAPSNPFERLANLEQAQDAAAPGEPAVPPEASPTVAPALAPERPAAEAGSGSPERGERPAGPVGLDIGTSNVVVAQQRNGVAHFTSQLNAYFTIPASKFSRRILQNNNVMFFESDERFFIYGESADSFANMFKTSTQRPIHGGLLNAAEKENLNVVQSVIRSLILKPKKFGETICFGVPGEPVDQRTPGAVTYHEQVLKMFLRNMGYQAVSVNEGMAVVLAAMEDDEYTGIGISMGGGMCNVCLSYLSFPVITFSIQFAGDYIDAMAGRAVGEPATKIKGIKETELDLTRDPRDMIHTALHIYYEEVIAKLLKSLQRVITASDKLPKIAKPIPVVLSGGTAMNGCHAKVAKLIDKISLPIAISEVRLAPDPLHATARGALIMAMTEAGEQA